MAKQFRMLIGGEWVDGDEGTAPIINPANGTVVGEAPQASVAQAEAAAQAAQDALPGWWATPPAERARLLKAVADELRRRQDDLVPLIISETGATAQVGSRMQVPIAIERFERYAQGAMKNLDIPLVPAPTAATPLAPGGLIGALAHRQPVGVVACISPYNFPVVNMAGKIAPALAVGCTVVMKPAPQDPLAVIELAEIMHSVGFPPGVINVVTSTGPDVPARLTSSRNVDMVSFTGSTRAGKRVAELAAASVKRVTLELGGKSASVILPDADLAAAVKGTIGACLLNSGQTCSAHTRMLVPAKRYNEVKALAQAAIAKFTLGASLDENTRLGPLVSAAQRDRVLGFIRQGLEEGAELVAGGPDKPAFDTGYFVQPTVLRVQPHDTLAREEIFGPVLVILTYEDEEEAIRIANDTIYGLGGGVWSVDTDHAIAVARRIRTGQVDINGAPFNGNAPFGGYKQSGNGRENGRYGLEEFLEFKALQLPVAAKA